MARRLAWQFVDLDAEFVRVEGTSIAAFFAARGEAAFRVRESELLTATLGESDAGSGLVLALGGGTLESRTARELLREQGGVVLLDVPVEQAWARVQTGARPLATDLESFRALLSRRLPTYEACADWIVAAGNKSVAEVGEEILALLGFAGDCWPALWERRLTAVGRPSRIVGGQGAVGLLKQGADQARKDGSRCFVMTDTNVMQAWGSRVLALLAGDTTRSVLTVHPGEDSKSPGTLEQCWEWLAAQGARRDDIVVALGGGVIGDLAGFAAATYQRGVGLWQLPTSLLAQVDSSVGGKTAVNLTAGKNLVGAFYQPDLVLIDPRLLSTLPADEFTGGLGEVVKHALLASETAFERMEAAVEGIRTRDPRVVGELVRMCVTFKAAVVADDERESGRRAILNLGHTIGHALELTLGYGVLNHGQAVALGLLVALAVSERLLGLSAEVRCRTRRLLEEVGLHTSMELPPAEVIVAAAGRDKKVKSGSRGFVGLAAVGRPVWGLDVSEHDLAGSLEVIAR